MNKKKLIIGGISVLALGIGYYLWKKSKKVAPVNNKPSTSSPLGDNMIATTLSGAKLYDKPSDKPANLVDYVNAGQSVLPNLKIQMGIGGIK